MLSISLFVFYSDDDMSDVDLSLQNPPTHLSIKSSFLHRLVLPVSERLLPALHSSQMAPRPSPLPLLLCIFAIAFLSFVSCRLVSAAPGANAAVDLSSLIAYPYGARQGSLRQSECPPACSRRCSKTSKHKACMFFCVKCCSKCLCVPPGTYGNKQVCPCYNDWKTQQGGPKCP